MLEGYFKTKAQILILARAYLVEKGFEDSNHFWVNDIEPVNNKDYEVRILFGNMGYNYYTKEVSKADLESYIEKHWKR